MLDPFFAGVGGLLSADIAVPEHEREMRFYSSVLTTGPGPLWRPDLMNSLGTPIIGLGVRVPEYSHLPLQWMPHIQVADVAQSAERALELGGKELMHGKDDGGQSQWAVFLDPNGAAFGMIPVVPAEGAPPTGGVAAQAGRISRLDLTLPDAPVARDFYSQVIGWSVQEVDAVDADGPYTDYSMLGFGGKPAACIHHARGVNANRPPVWLIHLPVGDLDESLRRVPQEGGQVIASPGGDGEQACAVVQDPIGAYLAIARA